ncbi:poly(A) RNA polymerase gld-2 homolog A isoform X2 [Patella vulgata]|uniref:poly(A) RNA polymerase gld-2 homolog A isoform X2 n=1 Tax=Patella vulgata TaxID=6465 RepID=UPI00217F5799|nr:poly(A) RNA polymerase gld-2 homolog A isoform X2 [Patella vulgata]
MNLKRYLLNVVSKSEGGVCLFLTSALLTTRLIIKGMYMYLPVEVTRSRQNFENVYQSSPAGAYTNYVSPLPHAQYNQNLLQSLPTSNTKPAQRVIHSVLGYACPSLYPQIPPPTAAGIACLKESIRTDILQKLNHSSFSSSSSSSPLGPTDMNNQSFHHDSQSPVNWNSQLGKRGRYGDTPETSSSKKAKMKGKNEQESRIESPHHMALGGALPEVTNSIWRYFLQNQQSEEVYQKKILLRKCLYAVLQGVFPYCGLYIVGSSMNGFGNTRSDMDLCLMVSNKIIDQKREATDILFNIHRALRKCSFISNANVIRAKVPILKFRDKISTVDCDLNINNSVGIRNTHLLKYYACNGCDLPVLPALHKFHPEMFSSTSDIRQLKLNENLKFETKNNQSLGELFLGFLDYYSNKFDYENFAISVRLGSKIPKRVIAQQTDNIRQWKYLCIEEPFDLSNTARAVYDDYAFIRIRRVFRVSFHKLNQKKHIGAILSQPF